ncbi:4Fe-4S binding protein [Lutispora sp.]|uniref:4Fe-4S binding protein n=1 Tax=Lutispora sp. TaxID=2828727 RepID=UPI000ED8D612|nr:4Fe-4S binding protein [Lutispora sp.]MEA4960795.1 4Fe-4S binding protein [Lutispora sp.]HCJ58041.1 6-hydroxynicotinate reductase [Clostridiaceae bacterium]
MIQVNVEKCMGCKACEKNCPMDAIKVIDKKAKVSKECVNCKTCIKVCKFDALSEAKAQEEILVCTNCGVKCEIPNGLFGACKRFVNDNGSLLRCRPLQIPEKTPVDKEKIAISKPLITAVGAGASYPDYHPAPYIVQENIDDYDVVTVVTEAPVSYSSMMVKIDTNFYIGDEGALVRRDGKVMGIVTTEQYGSHILIIGGVNRVKGPDGMLVVKTMTQLGNKEKVILKIDNGAILELEVGKAPIINGVKDEKMRVGCGGACCGLFAKHLGKLIDEAIILDHHITGLFTKHPAGAEQLPYSGVTPVGRLATPGRYFFEHGDGWGGTNIKEPIEAIKSIDMNYAKPGMKILVAETTWRKVALFSVNEEGKPVQIPLTEELEEFRKLAADNCEDSRVSAMYYAGVGGSARAGVTVDPIKLTQAVHRGDAVLTIAGAPAYVMPGGGITFLADVEKMVEKPFNYTASPAVVAPIEYTIVKEKYGDIGGHIKAVRKMEEVIKEDRYQIIRLEKSK